MKRYSGGSAGTDLVWLIGLMSVLFVVWVFTGGPNKSPSSSPFLNPTIIIPSDSRSDPDPGDVELGEKTALGQTIKIDGRIYIRSPFFGEVTISRGTAKSESRTGREYITLRADRRLDTPINISGWSLENGDAFKNFEVSGNIFVGTTDKSIIPNGINIFLANVSNPVLGPIVLNAKDEAVVVTGGFSDFGDIKINHSFRTNICTGYIENLEDYNFRPKLDTNCPNPISEPGVSSVSDSCFEFIDDMNDCHTPDTEPFRKGGDLIINHVDGDTSLNRSCREFIEDTFNYNTCVDNHITDKDFLGDQWRIFLGRDWEMWKEQREIISLFDSAGRLVDQVTY